MSEAQKATLGCLLYSYNSHFVALTGYKHWTITLSEIKSWDSSKLLENKTKTSIRALSEGLRRPAHHSKTGIVYGFIIFLYLLDRKIEAKNTFWSRKKVWVCIWLCLSWNMSPLDWDILSYVLVTVYSEKAFAKCVVCVVSLKEEKKITLNNAIKMSHLWRNSRHPHIGT